MRPAGTREGTHGVPAAGTTVRETPPARTTLRLTALFAPRPAALNLCCVNSTSSRLGLYLALSTSLLGVACSDEPAGEEQGDAGRPPEQSLDAGSIQPSSDAAHGDAGGQEAGAPQDAGKPKAACQLLPASEVAAILGVGQQATDLVGGMQCQYSSLDPQRKDVRALLEVVTNGRAIYAANLQMYAEAGRTAVPQSGIGDQAAFVSESVVQSSLQSTVGDVLLRLNLGWGEPGTTPEAQLAGERTLMLSAISRL